MSTDRRPLPPYRRRVDPRRRRAPRAGRERLADAPAVGPTAARSQAPTPDSGPSQPPTVKPTAKPTQRPEQEEKPHGTSGSPKGGVKAGTEGVRDAGDPVFIAAGGGMAAAGAAGLGYAMMRRGRTDA